MKPTSPAQRHMARVLAEKAAATSIHGEPVQGSAYDLMCAKLITDRQRLKQIQSIKKKIEVKREILPDYNEWVESTLKYGKGAQDTVLVTVLVWYIDTGDYARALEVAHYCMFHNLSLPDQYNRNLATMLLDEIPGEYLAGRFENPAEALATLKAVQLMTVDEDVPDQAMAKLYKALGYAQIGKIGNGDIEFDQLTEDDTSRALEYLRKALDLTDSIGVKKDIERLERRLKQLADAKTQTQAQA
ncbi:phage terminase small subunit [Undibacterium sp. TC9W]|uniref:phage terminase small subunit n=1 Tax=Undibacterium sp. TC9W TaxID=3413053 RepID=UPI003BF3B365